jgi:hypothetical protein
MRKVCAAGVEDALDSADDRSESAESDAEGEAQMVGSRLVVQLLKILGEWCAFGAVDSCLSPILGVLPWRGAGAQELNRWFTVEFMRGEGLLQNGKY